MKKSRFSEEQIIKILGEAEKGVAARDLCKKHNVSEQTFYRWRQKFGGMSVPEAHRLRDLERENGELKKLVADLSLDVRMLKDVNSRKW